MGRNEGTIIRNCTCVNMYQDQKYGKGRRVHNATQKMNGLEFQYRCSSCEKERSR